MFHARLAICCVEALERGAMIPVSTSVLMVLLKPLQVLSAVQRVFSFGPRKGKSNESAKPEL